MDKALRYNWQRPNAGILSTKSFHTEDYTPSEIVQYHGAIKRVHFDILKGAKKVNQMIAKEYEVVLKLGEAHLVSHLEIAGLQTTSVDVSLKLDEPKSEDMPEKSQVVFHNEALFNQVKGLSSKYQKVLIGYKPPVSFQSTSGKACIMKTGTLPATHIKIRLHGGKGSREG